MNIDDILIQIENLGNLTNIEVIGFSTFGRPIYALHIGSYSGPQVFMEGGIHAREYLSTLFLIEESKYLIDYYNNTGFDGGFYIVPLVNPDGVGLVLDGLDSVKCDIQRDILELINNGDDFSLWKANGLGVDLNVNFNAEWGKGTQNVNCPSSGNFVGFYPESERETQTIINFLLTIRPNASLSWHTKGEIIYYGFYVLSEESLIRDYDLAEKISNTNGYPIIKTEGSVGGVSDWVSEYLDVPAYTIEIGAPELNHPIGREYLDVVFKQNKDVPIVVLDNV